MKIEFDPDKEAANLLKHGFSLEVFSWLNFEQGLFFEDARYNYGEKRMQVIAPIIGKRLCVGVFTMRGDTFRVLSLRKANARERRMYDEKQSH